MKTIFKEVIMLGMLLFIPGLYSFGQLKNDGAIIKISGDTIPTHPSAMLEVRATDKGILIPRLTQAQRIGIIAPANGLMVYQIDGNSGFYYFGGVNWKRIGENAGHYVGELFGGGVVFWVNHTGDHGLICSMVDLSPAQAWSNVTDVLIGDSAQSDWNGHGNSLSIVGQQGHTTSAAKLCLDYINAPNGTGTFNDWYLPSNGEAKHLFNNLYDVNKALDTDGDPTTTSITTNLYWSSTEESDTTAWGCGMHEGPDTSYVIIKSEPLIVRAVRAFQQ